MVGCGRLRVLAEREHLDSEQAALGELHQVQVQVLDF